MFQHPTTSLIRAATSTFESLALLFPEEETTIGAEFLPLGAATAVRYHGPVTGRVVIGVTGSLMPVLAENMLGADGAPDPAVQRDALGEVANVVAGNLLPLLAGGAAVFTLDAPAHLGEDPWTPQDGETRLALARLKMDEGESVIGLFVDAAPTGAISYTPEVSVA
jgi:CheY-specific phosphatase CheX